MICPKCGAEQREVNLECISCGVIFAKLTPADFVQSHGRSSTSQSSVKKATRPTLITTICVIGILGTLISVLLIFFSSSDRQREGRFIAYNNGTVLDTLTNLMWSAKDNGRDINWASAKDYCENYREGGYTDWRMPTHDELKSLYDTAKTYKSDCGHNVHLATELIRLTCSALWADTRRKLLSRGTGAPGFSFASGSREWARVSGGGGVRALPVRSGR